MNSMECPGSFTSLTPRQSSLTTSTMMEVDQVSIGGGGGGGGGGTLSVANYIA